MTGFYELFFFGFPLINGLYLQENERKYIRSYGKSDKTRNTGTK